MTEVAVPAAPKVTPTGQPAGAEPDTAAATEASSEPAKRRFDFSLQRSARLAAFAAQFRASLVASA